MSDNTDTFNALPHSQSVDCPRCQVLTYLPKEVELFFKEALGCYHAACYNAFASMCRRTAQVIFTDLGETGKLKLFDELSRIRDLSQIDADTYATVKKVIFGNEHEPKPTLPQLENYQAGVLLEIFKDLLYQTYVRRVLLQKAILSRPPTFEGQDYKAPFLSKVGT